MIIGLIELRPMRHSLGGATQFEFADTYTALASMLLVMSKKQYIHSIQASVSDTSL